MCLKYHWNFEHVNLPHENFKKLASMCYLHNMTHLLMEHIKDYICVIYHLQQQQKDFSFQLEQKLFTIILSSR